VIGLVTHWCRSSLQGLFKIDSASSLRSRRLNEAVFRPTGQAENVSPSRERRLNSAFAHAPRVWALVCRGLKPTANISRRYCDDEAEQLG
jgi:hypothetical protein